METDQIRSDTDSDIYFSVSIAIHVKRPELPCWLWAREADVNFALISLASFACQQLLPDKLQRLAGQDA